MGASRMRGEQWRVKAPWGEEIGVAGGRAECMVTAEN